MNFDNLKDKFKKEGYVILRDVFSEEQVQRFRSFIKSKVIDNIGEKQANYKDLEQTNLKDVLSYPELKDSILNEKLLKSLKIILDSNQICYWGYSSFRYNEMSYRAIHNDAKNDYKNPFISSYPLVRIGIYLQDHKNFSNGVKILKNTCHTNKIGRQLAKKIINQKEIRYLKPINFFNSINADTLPGDVIIWNLRTCHSGNALRFKYFQNLSLSPFWENFIEKHFPDFCLLGLTAMGCIMPFFLIELANSSNFSSLKFCLG